MNLNEFSDLVMVDGLSLHYMNLCFVEGVDEVKPAEDSKLFYSLNPDYKKSSMKKKADGYICKVGYGFEVSMGAKESDSENVFLIDVVYSVKMRMSGDIDIDNELKKEITEKFLPSILLHKAESLVEEMVVKSGFSPLNLPVFVGNKVKRQDQQH